MRFVFSILLLTLIVRLSAQPNLKLIELNAEFDQPVDMTKAQDGTDDIYVTERLGKVYRYSRSDEQVRLVLDLTDIVVSKTLGGLVGLDFHPAFPDSAYFYVNYTTDSEDPAVALVSVISRFTMGDNDVADLDSEYKILEIDQPGTYHNLGDVAFGPDGYLYIPSGDGSLSNDEFRAGQNPQSMLGKLLRVDVDRPGPVANYSIPPSNPYANSTDTLPEIWSIGLRNPRQLSFDRNTQDLWIGDIGEFNYQEMNYQKAGNTGGQNYGWSCMEGSQPYLLRIKECNPGNLYDQPRFEYPRTSNDGINGAFIVGGYVYRGPVDALNGYFFFGDFLGSALYMYYVDSTGAKIHRADLNQRVSNVSCFGESNDGSLFVGSYNGKIYRIEAAQPVSTPVKSVTKPQLSVFPNPARSTVRITSSAATTEPGHVQLLSLCGKEIASWTEYADPHATIELQLPPVPPGLYLIRMEQAGHQTVAKLTIH